MHNFRIIDLISHFGFIKFIFYKSPMLWALNAPSQMLAFVFSKNMLTHGIV